ncbi:TetR/AcrR family transcriptional regulator [Leucobacter soli]|uniref:HTH tetR-type domain-containing protein n=1 Tax=Leucobacter soli TaxID=2812850 RepID=A0A916JW41_9MICO|nr:TetR/AcrR family transcriptional regulator [Leucobacter soli]CAG7609628.1 hypothetical protein LEUCIP111803_01226 [Leucobacter soli]
MPTSRGRPRLASPELLQEAAFELFQLRGYRGTSVEQIAKTAGFSRATFFNFFSSKAELFWVETDALIDALHAYLERRAETSDPPALRDALLEYADTVSSAEIPWALQHARLLDAPDDLIASGASRVLGLDRLFLDYLGRSSPEADPLRLRGEAASVAAQLLVGVLDWIDAGVERRTLREHLSRVL